MKVASYERKAIELLCSDILPTSLLHEILTFPEHISCKFTGAGYYLDLKHHDLPRDRTVCNEPNVIGYYQSNEISFTLFIEDSTICLECYSYGNNGIPESIRNGTVQISTT